MLVLILVLFLVAIFNKWIILISTLPFQSAFGRYVKGEKSILTKVFAAPYYYLNKITGGGYTLWSIYKIGLCASNYIRKWFCSAVGVSISENVVMHIGLQIRTPWKLSIGKGSIIGDHCTLDARSGLVIGSNVNISSNVSIWTLQHDYRNPDFACPTPNERRLDVRIEDRVWLGCNVIVLPGVTIGEGAVCCGGCVVTKDVEPYSVVAGIPAKKIGERPRNMTYEFTKRPCWFY